MRSHIIPQACLQASMMLQGRRGSRADWSRVDRWYPPSLVRTGYISLIRYQLTLENDTPKELQHFGLWHSLHPAACAVNIHFNLLSLNGFHP